MKFDSKGILQSEYSDLNGSLQVTLICFVCDGMQS